jgi:hypothetical protein
MGLFNIVKLNIPCPNCGKLVGELQTKDGFYEELYLEQVDLWMVRECHTICDHCNTWVSVKLKKEKMMELTLADYDVTSRPLGEFKEVKLNEGPKEDTTPSVSDRDNLEGESRP